MAFLSTADFLATYPPFFPSFTSRLSGTLLGTIIRFRAKSCIHFPFTFGRVRESRYDFSRERKRWSSIGEIFVDASLIFEYAACRWN